MTGSSKYYGYQPSAAKYAQSSYSTSANISGHATNSNSYSTERYAASYSPSDRFYATGQPTGRSTQGMARQIDSLSRQLGDTRNGYVNSNNDGSSRASQASNDYVRSGYTNSDRRW